MHLIKHFTSQVPNSSINMHTVSIHFLNEAVMLELQVLGIRVQTVPTWCAYKKEAY